jgi:hypothetical protein
MKRIIYIAALLITAVNFTVPVHGKQAAHCKIDANLPRFDLNASKTTVVPLERSTPRNSPHQIICENAEVTIYTEKGNLILKGTKIVYNSMDKSFDSESASISTMAGVIIGKGKRIRLSLNNPYAVRID